MRILFALAVFFKKLERNICADNVKTKGHSLDRHEYAYVNGFVFQIAHNLKVIYIWREVY